MPLNEQILQQLRANDRTLTTLDLSNNRLGEAGAQALANTLATNTTLTALNLRNNYLGEAGAQALANALTTNTTLTALDLYENKLGVAGAQALANSLTTNTTLTTLDLSDTQLGEAGVAALAHALTTNTTLTTLNLGWNYLGVAGTAALAHTLTTNTTLTSLNLRFNQLDNAEVTALAHALITNTTLTSLYLEGNNLGEAGATALVHALTINTTLTVLNLGFNQLGEAGAQALAHALTTNTALITLYLYSNRLGEAGAQALAHVLTTNTTLTSLNLGDNYLGEAGAQALARALTTNTTLTSLNLWGNRLGEAGAQALANALATNTTLTSLYLGDNRIGDTQLIKIDRLMAEEARKNRKLAQQFLAAVTQGDLEQVKGLIQQGASLQTKNEAGQTVIQLADQQGLFLISHYLTNCLQQQARAVANSRSFFSSLRSLFRPNPTPQNLPAASLSTRSILITAEQLIFTLEKQKDGQVTRVRLGKGSFGEVFKGEYQGQPVAIKQLTASAEFSAEEQQALQDLQQETSLMWRLDHPNIVRLLGVSIDKTPYCLVMELMTNGSLKSYITKSNRDCTRFPLTKAQQNQITLDLTRGLALLHQQQIIHRDLKPDNVLLTENLRAKLADFGLAKVKEHSRVQMTGEIGTLGWMAPEVRDGSNNYHFESDMYSYALILWALWQRNINPIQAANTYRQQVKAQQNQCLPLPFDCTPIISQIIISCQSKKPKDRYTAEQTLNQLMADEALNRLVAAPLPSMVSSFKP